jgi:transcriptional regulator with XRE-family HTH domain
MKGSRKVKGIESQLRQAIQEAQISRNRLSILSGIDPAQLCYFVQGKRTLTLKSAEKIAEVLGLELVSKKKKAPANKRKKK